MQLIVGGAFCLLSVFCALMMFYFDKRAQRILHRDDSATGTVLNKLLICY